MTCPSCGAQAPDRARFCPSCGHTLVSRPDERRIATVLFADLVGFTTFSEAADPEKVKNLIDRCFEALVADVVAFGGQVDKIVGDAIVALFGAPLAHEDDAERAVRAALQMQRTLAALREEHGIGVQMRIGVNTGEVLVGALRAGGDYTAMGDVVNTASRLQASARPGQVIVGRVTYETTRRAVRYDALGSFVVKGREVPVEAWAALEAVAPPGQRPRREPTALVGREPEMALLRRLLDAALARRRAQLVLLFGEAGVGKSRLASELATVARQEAGATVLSGQCVPYGEANVWWPVAEAIRLACGVDAEDEVAEARTRIEATVAEAIGRDPHDADVERTADGLLYVLGLFEEREDVDPARARDDARRSVLTFLEVLARQRPLVLAFSDLHWADDLVLEFVDGLMARLRSMPVVLVATARADLEERWNPAPGRHNVAVLHLEPLDADATVTLIHELLGAEVAQTDIEFLRDRSGGNPFFLEELVALLREAGAVGVSGSFASREPPMTLRGLVAARLDALDPDERSLLEDCAVVGPSGSAEAVDALAQARRTTASRVLDELADRELIVLDDDQFSFKSELIRDVAYGTLTKAVRARRHAALAAWMLDRGGHSEESLARLADHYGEAADLVRELGPIDGVPTDLRMRAAEVLEQAGDRAEVTEAWRRAERRYARAVEVLPDDAPDEHRWRLRLSLAQAQVGQRNLSSAGDDITEVLEQARASGHRAIAARALTVLADFEQKAGDLIASAATYEQAVAAWRELDDRKGVADALRGRGFTLMLRGELDAAEAAIREALDTFRDVAARRGEAWALQNLAWIAFNRGETDEADRRIHESVSVFAEIADWGGLSWALGLLAYVRYTQGRLDEAEELAKDVLDDASESGDAWARGMLAVLLADVALWRGRHSEALERGRAAREAFRGIGDTWGQLMSAAPVARALACLGRFDEALAIGDELEELQRGSQDKQYAGFPEVIAASISGHLGKAEIALREAEHAYGRLEQLEGGNMLGLDESRAALGIARLQSGDAAGACEVLELAYELAPTEGYVNASAGKYALSLAATGEPERAIQVTTPVFERDSGTYLDRLETRVARALALAQLGDEAGARAICDTAVSLANATESRVDQALVQLARAHALDALDAPDAGDARVEARARLDDLNLDAAGWETAYRLAATGSGEFASPDTTEVA